MFSTLVASCGLWYDCVSALHKEELDGPDIVAVDCDDNGITVFGSGVALDPLGSWKEAKERERGEKRRG